jgi:hypothetical protein
MLRSPRVISSFQAAPAGFTFLGQSGGGGAAALPPGRRASIGKVLPSETAALLFRVDSHGQPAASTTVVSSPFTPTVPIDQASHALDRFFASFNKDEWKGLVSHWRRDAPAEAESWALYLSPLK